MHPLAHMLTGGAIGQLAPSPALALIGGFLSHFALDIIPHTEGSTFRQRPAPNPVTVWKPLGQQGAQVWRPSLKRRSLSELRMNVLRADIIEAGVEFAAGVLVIGWLVGNCLGVKALSVGLGALGGILPDLIDLPFERIAGIVFFHPPGLHWTVRRRNAAWGILTQVAAAGVAAAYLWRAAGC